MMNQQDIFKKIGMILNELNDQYDFLAENPQQLNELEVELFLANANFLSEHVQIVKKLNAVREEKERLEDHPADIIAEPVTEMKLADELAQRDKDSVSISEQGKKEHDFELSKEKVDEADDIFKPDSEPKSFEFILNENMGAEKFDFEEMEAENMFDRPLSKEEEEILAQKKRILKEQVKEVTEDEEDEVGPEPFLISREEETVGVEDQGREAGVAAKTEHDESQNSIDKIAVQQAVQVETSARKPTINEILARNEEKESIGEKTVITDLKLTISLNEKLLYIKDLFNGYNLAYAEAIDLVNKMPDFKSADEFLQKNYSGKNNWADKQDTVDKFYELLNKRFSAK